MRNLLLRSSAVVCLSFSVFILAGCTQSGTTLSGKLVPPPGAKLAENDSVTIMFHPEDDANKKHVLGVYNAADNTFLAKDIPPGKYKVAVQIQPYQGSPDSEKRAKSLDVYNAKYNRENTKITYEVANDPKQSVSIDLEKGTATKN